MALSLGNKTKLTSDAEKLLIEVGGGNPDKTLTKQELSEALKNAITVLAENRSPYLIKLYEAMEKDGKVPPLDTLKDISLSKETYSD